MSLKTWKAEFYPVAANSRKALAEPVAHSLRKWEGLRAKNRKRHAIAVNRDSNISSGRAILNIDFSSCSLCEKYWRENDPESCGECPLYIARGNVSCASWRDDETISPYTAWEDHHDPRPMIRWLKRAAKVRP